MTAAVTPVLDALPSRSIPGARTVTVAFWELEKLAAQLRVRLILTACCLGPFAFALASGLTDSRPADTLFGRWIGDSGFAVPLVVLGFAASWGIPVLTGLVAGDLFASEDAAGTWPMLLTRSTGRGSLFAGKALALAVYVVVAVVVLAVTSLAAGLVVDGPQPLTGLEGNVLSTGAAGRLVLAAWASILPASLACAAVGLLLSVLTRNGVVAVAVAVGLGLAGQLALLVDGLGLARQALLATHLLGWRLLFVEPVDAGPVWTAGWVSLGYLVVSLAAAWLVFSRRDVTGRR